MSEPPAVTPARLPDVHRLATVVANAYRPLRAAMWLVPDTDQRGPILVRLAAILIEYALFHGKVDMLTDGSAVAVWLTRIGGSAPVPIDHPRRLATASGQHIDRVRALLALLSAHQQVAADHHQLALLAVDPGARRLGRGSTLLRHHHTSLDIARLSVHVIAYGNGDQNLLQRHGYRPGTPFALPDGTSLLPMWRPASPRGTEPGS